MQSQDTIEITTPGGKKVVIRNYTTHGDDKQSRAILNKGMTANATEGGEPSISFDAGAIADSQAKYVELLVQSIDGSGDNIVNQLDALRSEDYEAIAEAVREITTADPKATSKS